MKRKVNVLVSGLGAERVEAVAASLRTHPRLEVGTRVSGNGHGAPLGTDDQTVDVLILVVGTGWAQELEWMSDRLPRRPATLVMGPGSDMGLIRSAIQAGARDFIPDTSELDEVVRTVDRLAEEAQRLKASPSTLTCVMNAKGGSGATLLAVNLAHLLAVRGQVETALIDMDLQFGTLPSYLDLEPKTGILEVLEMIDRIDEVGLHGAMAQHPSGIRVLANVARRVTLTSDVTAAKVRLLAQLLAKSFERVVMDLPRQIDHLTIPLLEQANELIFVTQPSVAHLRDARRLVAIAREELEVPPERIRVVVNRFNDKGAVRRQDLTEAFSGLTVTTVPNDFGPVSRCVDAGTPLYNEAPRAPITRALVDLEEQLVGRPSLPKRGLFGRVLSSWQ